MCSAGVNSSFADYCCARTSPASTLHFFLFDHRFWQICSRQPPAFPKQNCCAFWSLVARALPWDCNFAMKTSRWETAVFFCFTVTRRLSHNVIVIHNSTAAKFWILLASKNISLFAIENTRILTRTHTKPYLFWHHFYTCSKRSLNFKERQKIGSKTRMKPSVLQLLFRIIGDYYS